MVTQCYIWPQWMVKLECLGMYAHMTLQKTWLFPETIEKRQYFTVQQDAVSQE